MWFRLGLWKIFGLDLWSLENSVFLFLFSVEDSKTREFGVSSLCGGDPSKHSKGVGNCRREGRKGNRWFISETTAAVGSWGAVLLGTYPQSAEHILELSCLGVRKLGNLPTNSGSSLVKVAPGVSTFQVLLFLCIR